MDGILIRIKCEPNILPSIPMTTDKGALIDLPDEDDLEEFETIGNLTLPPVGSLPEDEWVKFQQASWEDGELDDSFVEKLLEELAAGRKNS